MYIQFGGLRSKVSISLKVKFIGLFHIPISNIFLNFTGCNYKEARSYFTGNLATKMSDLGEFKNLYSSNIIFNNLSIGD